MNFVKKNSWTLDLEKIPSYVEWNGDWKYPIDREIIQLILECDDCDDKGNPIITDIMKTNFKKNIVDKMRDGILHIKWNAKKGNLGRRYSAGDPDNYYSASSNLGCHSKYIKNTIFHYQSWVDYDMVKGHASLLIGMGKRTHITGGLPAFERFAFDFDNGYADELIDYYSVVGENEDETKENRLTKGDVKDLHNIAIYGGGHQTWIDSIENGDELKGKKPKPVSRVEIHPYYVEFKKECKKVIDAVYSSNPKLVEKVCGDDELKEYEKKNRTMSYFCGILENEILKHAYKYGVSNGLFKERSIDLCYDGFTAPTPPVSTDMDFHINQMNQYIFEKTGFSVKMKVKPFIPENPNDKCYVVQSIINKRRGLVIADSVNDEPIETDAMVVLEGQLLENENVDDDILSGIIDDDNEGAYKIFEKIKSGFKFCNGDIWFKHNNIWINTRTKIENHLLNYILTKTNLTKLSTGKNPKAKPYSTNVSGARALREALISKVIADGIDDDLYNKFITTTKGRLCFLDGVLDFKYKQIVECGNKRIIKRGKFYKWNEIDFEYYSPIQIRRNFADYFNNPNIMLINYIKKQVFGNLFNDDIETALAFYSRGVAGHYEDKAWGLYLGNRNCGKGCISDLAKNALGDYHGVFEAKNILCSSNRTLSGEQPEKQLAFALDLQFCRLAFSHELPPPTKNKSIKVNGDIFKKLCSGGDVLKAKRNYDIFITSFINMSRMIVMCNDCPDFTNGDCLQTCCEFNSTNQFISQEEMDDLKRKNTNELILQKYMVGDDNVKIKCQTSVDYANAFIMLMLIHYQDNRVKPCRFIENDLDDDEDDGNENNDNNDLRGFIINKFDITNNKDDYVSNNDIRIIFDENDFGDISSKKIAIELKQMKLKCKRTKNERGWVGIKKKNIPDETIIQS